MLRSNLGSFPCSLEGTSLLQSNHLQFSGWSDLLAIICWIISRHCFFTSRTEALVQFTSIIERATHLLMIARRMGREKTQSRSWKLGNCACLLLRPLVSHFDERRTRNASDRSWSARDRGKEKEEKRSHCPTGILELQERNNHWRWYVAETRQNHYTDKLN